MREAVNIDGAWALDVRWEAGVDAAAGGELARLEACGETFARIIAKKGAISAELTTHASDNPLFANRERLTFELTAPVGDRHVRLEWRGYSVRLYAQAALADEDWPIGELPGGPWTMVTADGVCGGIEPLEGDSCEETREWTGPMQFFTWPGHNTGVGDCMPFARDGRYCLYFLFDRRAHGSKAGLGAHQWAQISSKDLKTWTLHPMAVPITAQWEGSICTGSLIEREGRIYAFYAVRMADGSPARLTWAVSEDGVRFEKSGQAFALRAPYEPVSARDPMVFELEGRYHMLVTTSLLEGGRYGGCLAHLVSEDLTRWEQLDPFLVPGYADQPECSDYFEWNGWYYLVFSNFATARYRMSRKPFGPWSTPEDDLLDGIENQVPKTAVFGDRRLVTGFLARYPRTYAGNAITHELVQNADGTLAARFVEEILPQTGDALPIGPVRAESAEGRGERLLARGLSGFRLRGRLRVDAARGGITLRNGSGDHRIDLERGAGIVAAFRPEEEFRRGDPRLVRTGLHLGDYVDIDMLVVADMLDARIDGKMLTMRLACGCGDGWTVCAHAQSGTVLLEDVRLEPILESAI